MGQPSVNDTAQDWQKYYNDCLEKGLRYQDFITDVLYNEGMVIVTYVSKARGRNAENKLGIEIKRDDKFRQTGNLYIETAERSKPTIPLFTPSGIYRDDNSWLYGIGDEKTLWIFSKKYLRFLARRYRETKIPTSRGYLLPLADADKYCLRRINIAEATKGQTQPI